MNYINNNINFKGYDAIKLKGLYMQGFVKEKELGICRQMKRIAEKEHINFFINQNGKEIQKDIKSNVIPFEPLAYWGQDRKAFIRNGEHDVILCHRLDNLIDLPPELSSYKIEKGAILPRGGNYFIGYKPSGEKWMIIRENDVSKHNENSKSSEHICLSEIKDIYGVEEKNIYVTGKLYWDLDFLIRPIGYPYVLVNSPEESLKNIEKMHEKFPKSEDIYSDLVFFSEYIVTPEDKRNELYECLKKFGFKPIKIGGFYSNDINFLNSIAFRNDKDKISLISNSTKYSCPEFKYLEELFEKDLREKVNDIENVYFVSGGKKDMEALVEEDYMRKYDTMQFYKYHNVIMDFLGELHGGIHCMTAEIPNFRK